MRRLLIVSRAMLMAGLPRTPSRQEANLSPRRAAARTRRPLARTSPATDIDEAMTRLASDARIHYAQGAHVPW